MLLDSTKAKVNEIISRRYFFLFVCLNWTFSSCLLLVLKFMNRWPHLECSQIIFSGVFADASKFILYLPGFFHACFVFKLVFAFKLTFLRGVFIKVPYPAGSEGAMFALFAFSHKNC